ncbi:TrkA family potassium uptake protein [Algivirga pacifica]|uniref:TrkA family potassium uptake protein n=1 Tax=Algivirga pacifica TaxID=1162670 RepID=A0ABP9DNG4_9BACT
MNKKIAVIGLGHFGRAVARKLSAQGVEVLAIDRDLELVDVIKDDVAYAVALDSTDIKALKAQNVVEMDAILVAIGKNVEGLLLTTVLLQELGVKRIVARAVSTQQKKILEKLQVEEIIDPETHVGGLVAEQLITPERRSFMALPDGYEIVQIKTPTRVVGSTVDEIDFQDNYDLRLIGLLRGYEVPALDGTLRIEKEEHLVANPQLNLVLAPTDILILYGKTLDIETFIKVNK